MFGKVLHNSCRKPCLEGVPHFEILAVANNLIYAIRLSTDGSEEALMETVERVHAATWKCYIHNRQPNVYGYLGPVPV